MSYIVMKPKSLDCCANLWMTVDMNIVLAACSLRDHLMESTSIYLSGLKKPRHEYIDMNIVLAAHSRMARSANAVNFYIFIKSEKYDIVYRTSMAKVVPLKTESVCDVNVVITGGPAGYDNDNLECNQWWKSSHHEISQLSVIFTRHYTHRMLAGKQCGVFVC